MAAAGACVALASRFPCQLGPGCERSRLIETDKARIERLIGEPLMAADPLLTLPQAAAILGVSTQKARRLIRAQLIEYNPRLRRSLRLSGIQRVAEARAASST